MRKKAKVGDVFNMLTVIDDNQPKILVCRCECGKIVSPRSTSVTNGRSKSCGCLRSKQVSKINSKDIVGVRFGKLVVTRRLASKNKCTYWECNCDCGKIGHIVSRSSLTNGTKSCGCSRKEIVRHKSFNTTHGMTGTTQYRMWASAKKRAKLAGVPFDLAISDIPEVPSICPMLGIDLKQAAAKGVSGPRQNNSPSLDRIIPSLGYVIGNIQIISVRANVIKSDSSFEEFEAMYLSWKSQVANQNDPHSNVVDFTKGLTPPVCPSI